MKKPLFLLLGIAFMFIAGSAWLNPNHVIKKSVIISSPGGDIKLIDEDGDGKVDKVLTMAPYNAISGGGEAIETMPTAKQQEYFAHH